MLKFIKLHDLSENPVYVSVDLIGHFRLSRPMEMEEGVEPVTLLFDAVTKEKYLRIIESPEKILELIHDREGCLVEALKDGKDIVDNTVCRDDNCKMKYEDSKCLGCYINDWKENVDYLVEDKK
ncbi:hypothetical protein M0R36_10810 [bacterium]|jgi:hypothetical protein|nr:hypothetical protein [bacterium]